MLENVIMCVVDNVRGTSFGYDDVDNVLPPTCEGCFTNNLQQDKSVDNKGRK